MKVGIQARLKNGVLWEAAKKMGSNKALADHLGISPVEIGTWINFRGVPQPLGDVREARKYTKARPREFWDEIERKLFVLTGLTFEEIFPLEVRGERFLKQQKRIDALVEMPAERLLGTGAIPQLLPAPDALLYETEKSKVIEEVIATLRPREQKVIAMRFGLGEFEREYTFEECAQHFAVTRERVRQIEIKALNRLRQPARRKKLKPLLEHV